MKTHTIYDGFEATTHTAETLLYTLQQWAEEGNVDLIMETLLEGEFEPNEGIYPCSD